MKRLLKGLKGSSRLPYTPEAGGAPFKRGHTRPSLPLDLMPTIEVVPPGDLSQPIPTGTDIPPAGQTVPAEPQTQTSPSSGQSET